MALNIILIISFIAGLYSLLIPAYLFRLLFDKLNEQIKIKINIEEHKQRGYIDLTK